MKESRNSNSRASASLGVDGDNSQMKIEWVDIGSLRLSDLGARTYSRTEIDQAARVIRRMGIREPILVDPEGTVLVGEIIFRAAMARKVESVPVVRVDDLSPSELKSLSVAYSRLGEMGEWDRKRLGELLIEFKIEIPNFEEEDLGFDIGVLDLAIDAAEGVEPEESFEELASPSAVSREGDLWLLGKHRLICGDATRSEDVTALMNGSSAAAMFTDPPFGCPIDGFVSGKGRHREFVMGSGEMNRDELHDFFVGFIASAKPHLKNGAVIYLVIDWRSLHLLLEAATPLLGQLINLAVWAKDRAGMGSFLRSQHELILIFKAGTGKFQNNVMLGKHGRDRSNVWSYPSAMTGSKGSEEGNLLAEHPTPKPVRLVADALLDCTKRGQIVLDLFLGSGTTLIAAEKVGRVCHAVELDPVYVDLAIRRWQRWTGLEAVHAMTGRSFTEVEAESARAGESHRE